MPIIEKVAFNLWAVLIGMLLLGGTVCGILYADQKDVRLKQQEINQRVTRLETAIVYIAEGINELKKGQTAVKEALDKVNIVAEKARRDRQ